MNGCIKANLRNKKLIVIIICIILVFCITARYGDSLAGNVYASFNGVNSYLRKNHTSIDMNSNDINGKFSILDDDISRSSVILTGEAHAVKDNYILRLALIKYLNQKFDVKYLLTEIGYSSSCYINQYLESGDESKLKIVYLYLAGTESFSKEDYNFWVDLRKYNLTVPENKRIKVIGIDIEHQTNSALKYLIDIIPSEDPPEKIRSAIANLKKSKQHEYILEDAIKELQSDIAANSSLYSSYLGNNYFDFTIIADNIVSSINAYHADNANFIKVREPFIYSNFRRIYSHLPEGKFFGEFGMEHVYQKTCNSYMGAQERFAMYLNSSDSPVKGKVLSIAYGYENCSFMDVRNNYCQNKCDSLIKDIDILNKYSKSDLTIFKLNGNNSPFNKKLYFVEGAKDGHTTDYFKYIILIKNSKGTVKLGI